MRDIAHAAAHISTGGSNTRERVAPQKPAEVEQHEGRILRQGNDNEQVSIYRYATEGILRCLHLPGAGDQGSFHFALCCQTSYVAPTGQAPVLSAHASIERHITTGLQRPQELHQSLVFAPRFLPLFFLDLAVRQGLGLHLQINLGVHVGRY